MSTYSTRGPRGSTRVLDRAFAAGAALSVAAVAMTGVFVAKIASSYAATKHRNSVVTGTDQGGVTYGGDDGGQVSVPQQNQQPVGGSNGS